MFTTTGDPGHQCQGGLLCSGDFTTPEAGFNPKIGILTNVDDVSDYYGSFHNQVATVQNITVEAESSDKVSGTLFGVSFGEPS